MIIHGLTICIMHFTHISSIHYTQMDHMGSKALAGPNRTAYLIITQETPGPNKVSAFNVQTECLKLNFPISRPYSPSMYTLSIIFTRIAWKTFKYRVKCKFFCFLSFSNNFPIQDFLLPFQIVFQCKTFCFLFRQLSSARFFPLPFYIIFRCKPFASPPFYIILRCKIFFVLSYSNNFSDARLCASFPDSFPVQDFLSSPLFYIIFRCKIFCLPSLLYNFAMQDFFLLPPFI